MEKYQVSTEVATLDVYKLPPLFVVTEYPGLNWLFAQCTSKEQRKHMAACIILGQPFNYRRHAKD